MMEYIAFISSQITSCNFHPITQTLFNTFPLPGVLANLSITSGALLYPFHKPVVSLVTVQKVVSS